VANLVKALVPLAPGFKDFIVGLFEGSEEARQTVRDIMPEVSDSAKQERHMEERLGVPHEP
jgi:hypothetical protein